MSEMLKDFKKLLYKIEMSQTCLADMIHDCKTKLDKKRKKEYEKKYYFINEIEKTLRKWIQEIEKGLI